MNQRDRINCCCMHTISNDLLFTLILVNKLSCVFRNRINSSDMIWSGCYHQSLINSTLNFINNPPMTLEAHDMLSIGQIENFNNSNFLFRASRHQKITDKFYPIAPQHLWLFFIDKLFGDLANISVSKKFVEILWNFLFLLSLLLIILIFEFVEVDTVPLLFIKNCKGKLPFSYVSISRLRTIIELHLKVSLIFLVIVPKKIIVNVRNKTLSSLRLPRLLTIFVSVKL